jgi:UDP-3-O-[3-hydroxymyristoyl] glucosamine N-acyltransferase
LPPSLVDEAKNIPGIIANEPRLAFALILKRLIESNKPAPGIHSTAVVAQDAQVDSSVHVGELAYIGQGVVIKERSVIHPQVHIAGDARVGADCILYPHCYIGPGCKIGDRVILGPSVSIGYDGFGYQWDGSKHVKIPQVGIVVIEDDVEIGALSAVDRATLGETRIGAGTKIDNLVMIGHNCKIGRNVILVAQVGLSGSVTIEDGAILAGQVGVVDGVRIGAGAIVAAQSGVVKDVPPGKRVGGSPARGEFSWLRSQILIDKLPELRRRIKNIEKRLLAMEKGIKVSESELSEEEKNDS